MPDRLRRSGGARESAAPVAGQGPRGTRAARTPAGQRPIDPTSVRARTCPGTPLTLLWRAGLYEFPQGWTGIRWRRLSGQRSLGNPAAAGHQPATRRQAASGRHGRGRVRSAPRAACRIGPAGGPWAGGVRRARWHRTRSTWNADAAAGGAPSLLPDSEPEASRSTAADGTDPVTPRRSAPRARGGRSPACGIRWRALAGDRSGAGPSCRARYGPAGRSHGQRLKDSRPGPTVFHVEPPHASRRSTGAQTPACRRGIGRSGHPGSSGRRARGSSGAS